MNLPRNVEYPGTYEESYASGLPGPPPRCLVRIYVQDMAGKGVVLA